MAVKQLRSINDQIVGKLGDGDPLLRSPSIRRACADGVKVADSLLLTVPKTAEPTPTLPPASDNEIHYFPMPVPAKGSYSDIAAMRDHYDRCATYWTEWRAAVDWAKGFIDAESP